MEKTKKYFSDLLILQYRNKPRAKATIETLVELTFSDTTGNILPIEVQNAYDIDTAVGHQLDIIGKYLGYNRQLNFHIDDAYTFDEYDGSITGSLGYSYYSQEKNTYPYLEYRYDRFEYYSISDATYRKVLKMLCLLRDKPLSLGYIDYALKEIFDDQIYVEEKAKELEYHISSDLYTVLNTQDKLNAFFNKFFPLPMGCVMTVVRDE